MASLFNLAIAHVQRPADYVDIARITNGTGNQKTQGKHFSSNQSNDTDDSDTSKLKCALLIPRQGQPDNHLVSLVTRLTG
jgi:hypothetical protein